MNLLKVTLGVTLILAIAPSPAQGQAVDRRTSPVATEQALTWSERGRQDAHSVSRIEYALLGAAGGYLVGYNALGGDGTDTDMKNTGLILSASTIMAVAYLFPAYGPGTVPDSADADAYKTGWRREAADRRRSGLRWGVITGLITGYLIVGLLPAT